MPEWELREGDCLEVLATMDADSIDALVTDPPAGIEFMGKAWDGNRGGRDAWVLWLSAVMAECYRVLKPGAHAFVWAIPRTSHWTATAIEDAGFEIRDVVVHLFGSGFPKSLDVSKAIDKAAGAEREVVGTERSPFRMADPRIGNVYESTQSGDTRQVDGDGYIMRPITAPATPEAAQWQGWGTALKPASEHWILARKPLSERNVAANVLRWGTGALNIGGCRVATEDDLNGGAYSKERQVSTSEWVAHGGTIHSSTGREYAPPSGRWPANVTLDAEAAELLDEQSGEAGGGGLMRVARRPRNKGWVNSSPGEGVDAIDNYGDSGGASRFFYTAKPDRAERNVGLHGFEDGDRVLMGSSGRTRIDGQWVETRSVPRRRANHHPTVKPVALMQWLCRLITPPGGTVLDPFTGSGTTGMAALREGFSFIGIEREPEYVAIARARIEGDAPLFNVAGGSS